ncbi:unnamed protein product, partial [Scytosiphon promiscuus]
MAETLGQTHDQEQLPLGRPAREPEQSAGPLPAFVDRTLAMVDEPSSDAIVSWSKTGDTFVIKRLDLFEEEVIPRFFNHRNLLSFARQLNNHGFSRVGQGQSEQFHSNDGDSSSSSSSSSSGSSGRSSGRKTTSDSSDQSASSKTAGGRSGQDPNIWWEYKHVNFRRGRRELMSAINRKKGKTARRPVGPSVQQQQQERQQKQIAELIGRCSLAEQAIALLRADVATMKGGVVRVDSKIDDLKGMLVSAFAPEG